MVVIYDIIIDIDIIMIEVDIFIDNIIFIWLLVYLILIYIH